VVARGLGLAPFKPGWYKQPLLKSPNQSPFSPALAVLVGKPGLEGVFQSGLKPSPVLVSCVLCVFVRDPNTNMKALRTLKLRGQHSEVVKWKIKIELENCLVGTPPHSYHVHVVRNGDTDMEANHEMDGLYSEIKGPCFTCGQP
jgi:hypothetical protein